MHMLPPTTAEIPRKFRLAINRHYNSLRLRCQDANMICELMALLFDMPESRCRYNMKSPEALPCVLSASSIAWLLPHQI